MDKVPEVQKKVAAQRNDIIKFLRDICAIPPHDGLERSAMWASAYKMR